MERLVFSDKLSFSIAPGSDKLRVIIFTGEDELACHKVTAKVLLNFLQATKGHLFKGRLQMDNHNGAISISVKGKKIGDINYCDILTLINNCLLKS